MSVLRFNANVFVLTASLSFHYLLRYMVSAQPGTSGTTCRWNQLTILHPAGTECVDCPECPEGFGLDPQCGSRITSGVTVECVACQEGKSYSDKHDLSSCKPCTICDPNEETISPCTATKNAVCGKCKPGYYRAVTEDCHPCSLCCDDSKDEDKEKQCIEQTSLSANQVCRYDVNTIKCASPTNDATATAPGSKGDVAFGRGEDTADSGIWLLPLLGGFAVAVALGLLITLLYIYHKRQIFSRMWWRAVCVTHPPMQVESSDSPRSLMVIGRKESRDEMV